VLTSNRDLEQIGAGSTVTFDVARQAATLISPNIQDLPVVIPVPPQVRERLVFITDLTAGRQCSACLDQPGIPLSAMQDAVLHLYGPEGDNQTSTFRLASYSFENLQQMLDGNTPPYIEPDLQRANWVVLLMAGTEHGQPALVSRFLSERQDLLRERRVILFTFGAPYYMDATDISKLTAYYALYSKQPPFVDVAARLLFQELTPVGASPVSIPGIGYDLIEVMTPDPDQVIPLSLDLPPAPAADGTVTPEPTPAPVFQIGDTIALRAGVIRDHNGRPVPDGTVVRFSMTLTGEGGGILQQVEAVTTQGLARATFGLEKTGLLEIHVVSEPAMVSEAVQMDVSSSGPVEVTFVTPELTREINPTAVAPPPQNDDVFVTPEGYPRFSAWFFALLLLAGGMWLTYWAIGGANGMRTGIRWALCVLLGGLIAYNYLALGLPGGLELTAQGGMGTILLVTILGQLLGLAGAWLWHRRATPRAS
jgi:beta-N-acetylhexosaminidase